MTVPICTARNEVAYVQQLTFEIVPPSAWRKPRFSAQSLAPDVINLCFGTREGVAKCRKLVRFARLRLAEIDSELLCSSNRAFRFCWRRTA